MRLRADKGYIVIGQETDGTVTPDDLGLGWTIGWSKGDFVGKRSLALTRPAKAGPAATGWAGPPASDGQPVAAAGGRCSGDNARAPGVDRACHLVLPQRHAGPGGRRTLAHRPGIANRNRARSRRRRGYRSGIPRQGGRAAATLAGRRRLRLAVAAGSPAAGSRCLVGPHRPRRGAGVGHAAVHPGWRHGRDRDRHGAGRAVAHRPLPLRRHARPRRPLARPRRMADPRAASRHWAGRPGAASRAGSIQPASSMCPGAPWRWRSPAPRRPGA